MHRDFILISSLLLSAAQPMLLGVAVITGSLLVAQAPAQAQSAEVVAKVAQAISVRIEGATQGSGVLVKREGNRYTVLTAWHVVSGHRPGEELDIYTPDGARHSVEQGSIKRLEEVDLAVLTFAAANSYDLARIGDVKSVSMGSPIYVAGFPLPSSAVPARLMRFLDGKVTSNISAAIPGGYQLLYSNLTLPGMSGGPVLNARGRLVGIHGRAETDHAMSEQEGVAVKTGTNQAVPIYYYYERYVKRVASHSAPTGQSSAPRGVSASRPGPYDRNNPGDQIARDASAVSIHPYDVLTAKMELRRKSGKEAIAQADKVLALDPGDPSLYLARGRAREEVKDLRGAILDYSKAIEIYAGYAEAYRLRELARLRLDRFAGCRDLWYSSSLGDLQARALAIAKCRA